MKGRVLKFLCAWANHDVNMYMAIESKTLEVGNYCPDFDLPGVDGKKHKLSDYADAKVFVVGITCNHCPYVQAYEGRFNKLANMYKEKGVSFICINPNDEKTHPGDSFENMKQRAEEHSFAFDYLRDETQEVARSFLAECTPEFFVYDQNKKLQYHGKLDDNHKDETAVSKTFLKDAIDSLLEGNLPKVTEFPAMGCSIKWR